MVFTATSSSAKRALIEDVDMLSGLPKDLIHHIMHFLPLVDAAWMTVLSKAWRNYWLSIPRLDFGDQFEAHFMDTDELVDGYKWWSVINNILLLHKDSILQFSLFIPFLFISESCPDITPWISYVLTNGVKSFSLINQHLDFPSKLPSNFFSLGLLEHLELRDCTIAYNPCFTGLRNLSSLQLRCVLFERGVATEFFACCPLLETLHTAHCSFGVDKLIINMPSLNKLIITNPIKRKGMFPSIHFKNASSLQSFSLNFGFCGGNILKGKVDMIKFLANSCALQKLCLGGITCLLLASSDILRILPTTFMQLKVLEFSLVHVNVKDVFPFVFGTLQSCLNMVELKISVAHRTYGGMMLDNSGGQEWQWQLRLFDNDHTFNHLHTIYIAGIRGLCVEMKLISYMLVRSPSLKRLSFTCSSFLTDSAKQEVHRQLLTLWKTSPKAEVVHVQSPYCSSL